MVFFVFALYEAPKYYHSPSLSDVGFRTLKTKVSPMRLVFLAHRKHRIAQTISSDQLSSESHYFLLNRGC